MVIWGFSGLNTLGDCIWALPKCHSTPPLPWGGTPKLKNSKRRQADEPYSGISELKIPGGSFGNWPEGRGKEQRLGSHRGDDDAPSADFASARGCCGSLSGSLQGGIYRLAGLLKVR